MGRCYEFGAVVSQGCDHAMVVVAQGGACGCSQCGALCRGRFSGCPEIVARPGYIPVLAPRSPRGPSHPPAASNGASGRAPAAPPAAAAGTGEARETATATATAATEHMAVDELLAALRDERALVAELTAEVHRLREKVDSLEKAIDKLGQSTLWGLLRRT